MISIKECSPNWERALKKHVAFMQPRLERRIDYYIKIICCIRYSERAKLTPQEFNSLIKQVFKLYGSDHTTFRYFANNLLNAHDITNQSEYYKLSIITNINPNLHNLKNVYKSLKELKKEIPEILKVEFKQPYTVGYRDEKIRSILKSDIIFLFDSIFDYSGFSKLDPEASWGPYQLLKELELNVCPYCNIQFTYTVNKGHEKITRPDLDHFLAQNEGFNKHLQVSFFNLIPSCLVCNQRLKNDESTCYTTHLNPYESNPNHKHMRFDYIPKLLNGANGNSDDITIQIKCDSMFPSIQEKVSGNKTLFCLEDIYQMHTDIVKDLIKRKEVWDASHISLTNNTYTNLNMSKSEAYKQLFCNYFDEIDFAKRPLSKLTKDIAEKLGLTK